MQDDHSLKSWILTTDHKRVGILYLITASYFFMVAGSFALMMRTQLAVPMNNFVDAQVYNQLVTMHGLLMALFVISPLGFAFANYIIPLQIGARDMSFPRLNALSYWFFFSGGVLLLSGIYLPGGAISTGWTVYAPLSETQYLPQAGVTAAAAGVILLALSMVLGTVNIGTTIFRQRAKGYRLMDLPAFTWGIIITLLMAWVAFPDLAAAVVLLALDRTLGSQIFLSQAGGALLWQQVFWFFGHPEVYILILPAFGAMYDIASVFAGQPIFQKKYVIYSMLMVAILSMGVWLHHMFMSGVDLGWLDLQSVTTGAISIPSDTLVLGLMFTLIGGRIRYKAPMLFTVGAIPLFIIGGITGVLLSVPALDIELHGAYWVVAHFHYMLAGTALWGLTAAMYYFFPKITGRMYSERVAQVHFVVAAIGVNTLYFPMFFLYQMPRRYYIYSASLGLGTLNTIATIGAFIYGTAQVIFALNLIYSWKKGPKVDRNPWGAWGFEWLTTSPPPAYNFNGTPKVVGNQLVIEPIDHTPHAPQPSWWPMMVGLGAFLSLFGVVVYEAYGNFLLGILGVAVLVFALLGWAYEDYNDKIPDMDTGRREVWPFGTLTNFQLGALIFISGDLAFIGAMVSSWFFVIWQAPSFNISLSVVGNYQSGMMNMLEIVALVASCFTMYFAYWAAQKRDILLAESGIVATLGLGVAFLALTLGNWSYMSKAGMGISTVSTNLTASFFYDFSLLHLVHILGMLGIVGYYAFRLPKIIHQRNTPASLRAVDDHHAGSAFDGLAVVTWLWIFVAVFGLLLMGAFMFA